MARTLAERGDRVFITGRRTEPLNEAIDAIRRAGGSVDGIAADATSPAGAQRMVEAAADAMGGIDVLVNAIGVSDRGKIEDLDADHATALFDVNVLAVMRCCVAAKSHLKRRGKPGGVIVNVGSLAGKVGSRYIGGYTMAKHALTGMTQQLRLEWYDDGIHVGIVHPGPIRRPDAGRRYKTDGSIPASAAAPGGGAKIDGLPPETVVAAILRIIDRRVADIVLPAKMRWLITLGNASPRLGDWLIRRYTNA